MPLVHLKTGRLEYKFEIRDKYTIIKGDSGSGKTTFYDLVSTLPAQPGINLSTTPIVAVPMDLSTFDINGYTKAIYVIDEDNPVFKLKDAASFFKSSCNYFIIITRRLNLDYLPINVDSVMRMKTSGKFHTLESFYGGVSKTSPVLSKDTVIITEDKKSSYNFLKDCLAVYTNLACRVEPAYGSEEERMKKLTAGRSKVVSSIFYHFNKGVQSFVIVYDKAAFGMCIDRLLECFTILNTVQFYVIDWESFEWYILNSKVYKIKFDIAKYDCTYESLESFATAELCNIIPNYTKSTLPQCLRRERCYNCPRGAGCKYRRFVYNDLIYSNLAELLHMLLCSCNQQHVDCGNGGVVGDTPPKTASDILDSIK